MLSSGHYLTPATNKLLPVTFSISQDLPRHIHYEHLQDMQDTRSIAPSHAVGMSRPVSEWYYRDPLVEMVRCPAQLPPRRSAMGHPASPRGGEEARPRRPHVGGLGQRTYIAGS